MLIPPACTWNSCAERCGLLVAGRGWVQADLVNSANGLSGVVEGLIIVGMIYWARQSGDGIDLISRSIRLQPSDP
jgi:hypothetical protein